MRFRQRGELTVEEMLREVLAELPDAKVPMRAALVVEYHDGDGVEVFARVAGGIDRESVAVGLFEMGKLVLVLDH